jgi:hypothetical protein
MPPCLAAFSFQQGKFLILKALISGVSPAWIAA